MFCSAFLFRNRGIMPYFYVLTMLCAGFNRTKRNIYAVNAIGGLMNILLLPVSKVAVTKILPSSLDGKKE